MNNTFGTYTYDARNELTSAGGVSYGYDPAGNRTGLANSYNNNTFVINPNGSQLLMRMNLCGACTDPFVTNYYIYGAGLLYQIDEGSTTTNTVFYHYDCRGSTIALTDSNGNPTDLIEYSPYGTTTYRYGTNNTPFLYNGRFGVQTDPNGLLYMRARYYNPFISRFLNPDPSGFAGGLNFYAFCNGNPISETDPFGLCADQSTGYSMVGQINMTSSSPFLSGQFPYYNGTGLASDLFAAAANIGSLVGNTVNAAGNSAFSAASMVGQFFDYLADKSGQSGIDSTSVAMISGLGILGEAATAEEEMVTVTHFTDATTVGKIVNGTGTLNAGSFVTLPSEMTGMTASEVEAALEIDAGKGAYSATFQTPRANLGPAFNGPVTSGGKVQFQLINPTPPGPFVPTH
jgi:RHS repeat-associated protein